MKPETKLKLRVLEDLKTLKNAWFFKSQEVCVRGIHDVIICLAGRFVSLELKSSGKAKLDPLQQYNANKILLCGGLVFKVFPGNWKEVFSVLQKIDADFLDPTAPFRQVS